MTKRNGSSEQDTQHQSVVHDLAAIVDMARASAARSINGVMNAAHWLIGRQLVAYEDPITWREHEAERDRLSENLKHQLGRGFGAASLSQMQEFYLQWPYERNRQGDSRGSASLNDPAFFKWAQNRVRGRDGPEATAESLADLAARFPLPWSVYVRLLSVEDESAREFYENQAIRGGWSVRQLDRQIISLLYDRTPRSGDPAGVLTGTSPNQAEVEVAPQYTVKDPFVLAFLDLDDQNTESDLKEVLIHRLETFLLELGADFGLVSRQQCLRVENEQCRVDRLFFHRRLRCLVVIDLKLNAFTDADADRMRRYLDHAREHWMHDGENPPVALTLCSQRGETVARYALEGLPNEMTAAEYRSTLPDEQLLAQEVTRAREALHQREWDRPSLKEVYSIGDWIYLDYRFGRVVAVRDSELDVDYGRSTSTLRSDSELSNIEKVHGPESENPGEPSAVHPNSPRCEDVYVALDGRHGKYSGKRGRLTGGASLVDFTDGGGKYFKVKFPGSLKPVLIDEDCVYGLCRKASKHPDRWLLKS